MFWAFSRVVCEWLSELKKYLTNFDWINNVKELAAECLCV
jgi:hypothetical protein